MQYSRLKKTKIIQKVLIGVLALAWLAMGYVMYGGGTYASYSLNITSSEDIGAVAKPSTFGARDGGSSGLLGGQILWTFGDTLYTGKDAITQTPDYIRSATSGIAPLTSPIAASTTLDAHGAPYQLLPYTSDELAYNRSTNDPNNRYALWPSAVVPIDSNTSLIFYLKLIVKGYLQYDQKGIGVARITKGSNTAVRDPNLLFSGNDPFFQTAMVKDSTLYLYVCSNASLTSSPCKVAKAPLSQATQRSAYQAWNGAGWGAIETAKTAIDGSTAGFSVQWNPYINQYVAFYTRPFSNTLQYKTADTPAGPWSEGKQITKLTAPIGGGSDYAVMGHPEFDTTGKTMYVSYFHPTGTFTGDLRVLKISLAANPSTTQNSGTTQKTSSGTTSTNAGATTSTTGTTETTATNAGTNQAADGTTTPTQANKQAAQTANGVTTTKMVSIANRQFTYKSFVWTSVGTTTVLAASYVGLLLYARAHLRLHL